MVPERAVITGKIGSLLIKLSNNFEGKKTRGRYLSTQAESESVTRYSHRDRLVTRYIRIDRLVTKYSPTDRLVTRYSHTDR